MNKNLEVLSLDSLPLGLRFRPTDGELISFYLRRKINGHDDDVKAIREVDICKWEPWDLPNFSVIKTKDLEWLFFCPLDRKYPNGSRQNRATIAGYWKATGKDRKVKSGKNIIGVKRTLVFHSGRAPKGTRTNWVMHEYRATEEDLSGTKPGQSPFVICKLFKKQDLNLAEEDSKLDEAEPAVSSPTVAASSPDETKSEVSMVPKTEDLKRYDIAESSLVISSDSRSGACDEVTTAELGDPNWVTFPELESLCNTMSLPEMESLNNALYFPELGSLNSTMFSPLHSQVQSELKPSFNAFQSGSSAFSGNHNNRLQISDFGDTYITDVLESFLDFPEEAPEKHYHYVSQCGFDRVAPTQTAPAYQQRSAGDMSNDVSVTGITLRTRQGQPSGSTTDYVVHGNASKRLRLQSKLDGINSKNPELQSIKREVEDTDGEDMKKGKLMRSRNITGFLFKKIVSVKCTYGGLLRAAVLAVMFLTSICFLTADFRPSLI